MAEAKSGAKKAKRVLKAGYKRMKTSSGGAYYVNAKTGNRVKKATATKAGGKRRRVGAKRRVARK